MSTLPAYRLSWFAKHLPQAVQPRISVPASWTSPAWIPSLRFCEDSPDGNGGIAVFTGTAVERKDYHIFLYPVVSQIEEFSD
jgi:hypothetical protein